MGDLAFTLAAAGETPALLRDLLIVLAVAGLIAVAAQRLRLAAIPAYLLAGLAIGPGALGLVRSAETLDALSRLATILLLFGVGMQLHLSTLRNAIGRYVAAGVGSVAVTSLAGWPIGMAFGLSSPAALAASMALSLSSTAVILQSLSRRRELHRTHGRMAVSILVLQDIAVLAILILVPALATWAGSGEAVATERGAAAVAWEALLRVAAMAALIIVAKALLPRLMHEAARGQSPEVLLVVSLAAAIGAAAAAQGLGFSAELGAFLAGFTLSSTPFRHQLSGQIGPLRDLFVAVFFTTIGMIVAPAQLASSWWVVLLGTAALLAVKGLVIGGACWAVGAGARVSVVVGLTLAQAGEFSLITLVAASNVGLLSESALTTLVAIVVVSLFVTPALEQLGRSLGARAPALPLPPWLRTAMAEPGAGDEHGAPSGHVVIAGFGPAGRSIAEELERAQVPYAIIELNPQTVRREREAGRRIIYGDASNVEVLESAGIRGAEVFAVTIPDEDAALRACETAGRMAPELFIAARTTLASKATLATALGADHVIVDEVASAEAMRQMIVGRLEARGRETRDAAPPTERDGGGPSETES